MTTIHFEIIRANEADRTVIARFWTNRLSVEMLGVDLDEQGAITSARSDLCIGLPPEVPLEPQSVELRQFVERCAPRKWLEAVEARLDEQGTVSDLLGAVGSPRDLVTREIQFRLDAMARGKGYDSIVSLCSYAGSSRPHFAAEARHGLEVRDAAWEKCYEILDAVNSGSRPLPTLDEVLAEMPGFDWPGDAQTIAGAPQG